MDPITIDTLARTLSVCGTRRQLVTVLAALPLVGLLTGLPADVAAERPPDRLQRRTAQRNRKQRNQNNTNQSNNGNNKNNKKNGGGLGNDYPNRCGDMVCPSDKPLCCEIYYDGNLVLACLDGTTCPSVTT